jgi:hypothetical protein
MGLPSGTAPSALRRAYFVSERSELAADRLLEVVRRLSELAHAAADGVADVRQLAGPEDDQDDDEQDDELRPADGSHACVYPRA